MNRKVRISIFYNIGNIFSKEKVKKTSKVTIYLINKKYLISS